jgi:Fe(II)/alpha-ketoglutarate-dependent arginine beta-hydroxylase
MSKFVRTVDYVLNSNEVDELLQAQDELLVSGLSPVEPDFYQKFPDCHELLPAGLRKFLKAFRNNESSTLCQVQGFPVDDSVAGPTPERWERPEGYGSTLRSDVYLAMCASALGDPFSWATLQYGRLIQDIFPIRGDEQRESGHGSDAFLTFHTDDAFRPDTCDYLLLFGIRNHDVVPTYVAAVRDVVLRDEDRKVLSEDRFHILPDDEHIRQLELRAPDDPALLHAIESRDDPRPVSVLFDDPVNPHVRMDAPYMRSIDGDPRADRALAALQAELDRVRRPMVAAQGTLLILDNRSVVHARESFSARYDGTDRWLRKIIVSRDLSGNGTEPISRVLL